MIVVDDVYVVDLDNDEFLHFLLLSRDLNHFSQLGMKLMKAGKSGLFETWMLKESDLVQVNLKVIFRIPDGC